MAIFGISFTGGVVDGDPLVAEGVIQLGAHREVFESVLTFWPVEAYQANWLAALRRLVDGAEVSCLLTSVPDPAGANFFIAWPMYRSRDRIVVQNWLIFAEDLDREFDPDLPWEYVGPRITVDEDGNSISEWEISRSSIEEFISRENSRG